MKNKIFLQNPLYLIILVSVISTILVLLLHGTVKLEHKIEDKIIEISTSDVLTITQNNGVMIKHILKNSTNYIEDIKRNPFYQSAIEENLKLLLTKNIKYAYLLYKDKNGIFRFLADGSQGSEKAFINQKFDVTNQVWTEIYTLKKPITIKHSLLKELSISYLVPILHKNDVQLILAIDFSVKKVEQINRILNLMKSAIIVIIIIIVIFLTLLIIQSVKYVIVKKTAYYDKLTNTYNRNYLQELQDFINLENYVLAVLDIDYFKKFNDTYGHDVGDSILKQLSSILLDSTRVKQDIVIRYGGEEFLILSKIKKDDRLSALNVIERIFRNIREEKFKISENDTINLTISIGVNLTPHKSRTFSEAFKLADIALYNAKNNGRNCIQVYDENDSSENNSNMSINDIKSAIEEKRVLCYFQKIVNTKTQETSHYEALLRIIDKKGNIITPDKILPSIKGTFILRNITKRVLRICYEELKKDENISINVNINPQDIINEYILNILQNYAKEKNIANRLGIEVLETEDMIKHKEATSNILMLKNLGYKIFVDDFGSGYSNFIYMTKIQTDYIKIDGDIIKKINDDHISFLAVKNIVNFAKEANIKIVAEHVSDQAIYEKVKSLGIEYSQGYHFSIPNFIEKVKKNT